MANYTLTTSQQEVGSNLGVTVGGRLLAWYSDADSSGATVHLKLQAISQGITYTGTNKDYELTLDSTATGTVAWSYSPLPADTWVDVTEITQRVSFGSTVNVSGKVWTYVYGDAWIGGNTVTLASQYSQPTGLTVSAPYNIKPRSATFDVSVSSYGNPSSATGRYIEAAILGSSAYGSPYRFQIAQNTSSASIMVDNSSRNSMVIVPNTQYYYGGYADNTQVSTYIVAGQFVTAADGPEVTIGTKSSTSATLNYTISSDGGYYNKTLAYSLDNGSTWTTFATITSGSAASGSFTISGLTQGSTYTVLTKTTTTAGSTDGTTVRLDMGQKATFYGSANGQAQKIVDLDCSSNGQASKVSKFYGSQNGEAKLIQGFDHVDYGYGTVVYYTDNTYTATSVAKIGTLSGLNSLSSNRDSWTATIGGVSIENGFIKEVILTSKVTSLPDGFLRWCSKLEYMNLPSSITSIGKFFLYGCTTFNAPIKLPSGISTLGYRFMQFCDNMTSVVDFGALPTSIMPTGYDEYSLSPSSSSAAAYATGIAIAGSNRAAWLARFPNSISPRRKLIDAGY